MRINKEFATQEQIEKWMVAWCKQWCFQLEKGEEKGIEHFQCRFSLKVKERKSGLLKKMIDEWVKSGCYVDPTSKENMHNNFYVCKPDTRVGGPWTDKDNRGYVKKEVRKITNLYPWQEKVVQMAAQYDERCVDVIVEHKGCTGKSTLCDYMEAKGMAIMIEDTNDRKEIMRMVYGLVSETGKNSDLCFLVDMPRCANKDKLFGLYAAIEKVKGGKAYDDRYSYKKIRFDNPRIFVFSNKEPEYELLSKDRWRVWTIKDNDLVPFESCKGLEVLED